MRLKSLGQEWLSACNKLYLSPLVCISPKPLSFIIGNTDVDFLSSQLPTSPPITPVLKVSVGTKMTVACEIHFNLFAVKLILTLINSHPTADWVEGLVQGAVDILQHPSTALIGLCLLQISMFYI